MKNIKTAIKKQDLFGHVINLNFNQKGDSHKTIIGGLASILVKIIMAIYIYLSFEKLIFKLDDKNSTDYGLMDLTELGQISYNTTDIFNFYVLRK